MKIRISAVIITHNEEMNIERCLRSLLDVADEILVIDSYSEDNTEKICKYYDVRFEQHPFEGHVEQKNYAMSLASYDYILSLDGDEALSDELRKSILLVKENWQSDAYSFNRLNNYGGSWIKHCGWYPDRKIRLWDRRKGKWGGYNPHDKVIMEKEVRKSFLNGDLLHYSFNSMAEHVAQLNYFSDITARGYYMEGRRAGFFHVVVNPLFTFFRSFILQRGFLDGFNGFVICTLMAYGNFLKYAKLRMLRKKKRVSVYNYATVGSKRSIKYSA